MVEIVGADKPPAAAAVVEEDSLPHARTHVLYTHFHFIIQSVI